MPLHWWGLHRPWRPHEDPHSFQSASATVHVGTPHATSRPEVRSISRSRPFLLLTAAMALTSLSVFAVVINLVPMLVEQGMSRNLAALALGLGGVGQVTGRLGYARLAASTTVTVRTVVVIAGVAVATTALAVAPTSAGLLIALGMLLGLARGIYTLISATAITDRWGPTAYGTLNGLLTAPSLVASASAPFVGAALAQLLGSYTNAFLVLAGLTVLAAALALFATPPHHRPEPDSPLTARQHPQPARGARHG